jgi:hypothetical protein
MGVALKIYLYPEGNLGKEKLRHKRAVTELEDAGEGAWPQTGGLRGSLS